MKAWIVIRAGAPSNALQLNTETPAPHPPSGGDITVKVSHAALNPADLVLMSHIPTFLPFRRKPTPGFDFCGTVVAAGPTAPKDVVGSTVCGAVPVSRFATGTGSLAEYITVPANSVAKKPERLSDAAAAGLGIAGQTAALIMSEAHIQKGERVLLNGASGGVGTMMCQILKARGATVFGICSGRNEEMVKKLGASEVRSSQDQLMPGDLCSNAGDAYSWGNTGHRLHRPRSCP
jgi:NADPH:quinone reductase-like Zn-dependent oxidoreductase